MLSVWWNWKCAYYEQNNKLKQAMQKKIRTEQKWCCIIYYRIMSDHIFRRWKNIKARLESPVTFTIFIWHRITIYFGRCKALLIKKNVTSTLRLHTSTIFSPRETGISSGRIEYSCSLKDDKSKIINIVYNRYKIISKR